MVIVENLLVVYRSKRNTNEENTKDARSPREVEYGNIYKGDGFFDECQDTKGKRQTNEFATSASGEILQQRFFHICPRDRER